MLFQAFDKYVEKVDESYGNILKQNRLLRCLVYPSMVMVHFFMVNRPHICRGTVISHSVPTSVAALPLLPPSERRPGCAAGPAGGADPRPRPLPRPRPPPPGQVGTKLTAALHGANLGVPVRVSIVF